MLRRMIVLMSMVGLALTGFSVAFADIPLVINHQGLVKVDGGPFTGPGYFKFGFLDSTTSTWLWTNDGSHIGEPVSTVPDTPVTVPVNYGVYNVRLGDTTLTGMTAIPSSVFESDDVKLRVIFDDGVNLEEVLSPDQRMTSAAYAYHANWSDMGPSDTALHSYRANCTVLPNDASSLRVLPGELAIPNGSGTDVRYRRNESELSVTWADLDTGSEASSTQYYVYAVAGADETTFTVSVSASDSAPGGATYYRKIGYFYNDSSGDMTDVGNIKGGDAANLVRVVGTSDVEESIAYDVYEIIGWPDRDMQVRFVSSGRMVRVFFSAPLRRAASGGVVVRITIDGTPRIRTTGAHVENIWEQLVLQWVEALPAGAHIVAVEWTINGGTISQQGTGEGARILIVEEL